MQILKAPSILTAFALTAIAATASAQYGMRYDNQPGTQFGTPGTVTYSEGQAAIAGQPVQPRSTSHLTAGQLLATGNGTAELQLAPGAMLRLDRSSAVKAVTLDGKRSEIQLTQGRAEINVSGLQQGSEFQVDTPSGSQMVQTLLVKDGLYEFDVKNSLLRVFDGKAAVAMAASTGDPKWIDVKAGRQLALNASATQPTEFDRDQAADGFARRSDQMSSRGGGYGYRDQYGDGEFGAPGYPVYGYPGYGYGYPGYGYGFYEPFAFGFYPGFYGGYGFYGGGFYRGGFGGRGFRR